METREAKAEMGGGAAVKSCGQHLTPDEGKTLTVGE